MYKIMKDNPSIKPIKFNRKCPNKYYKAAIVIDPEHTYHFYRQDKNVRWSHKPGTLKVTNKDASGNPIYAPHLSDRNYNKELEKDGIDYTKFCNYFCVPKNSFKRTNAIQIKKLVYIICIIFQLFVLFILFVLYLGYFRITNFNKFIFQDFF